MSDKLINQVIQLTSKEERAGKFGPMAKIKDEKGLTYTVYKTKKDGTVSVAWEQLQTLSIGDNVQVSFSEEIGDYEGKAVTYRTIRSFNADIGNGVANSQAQAQSGRNEAPRASGEVLKGDAFGRRLAIHGFVNGLLAGGIPPKEVPGFLPELLKLEDAIDNALSAPLEGANLTNVIQPGEITLRDDKGIPLPVIQQDDLDGEDVPF